MRWALGILSLLALAAGACERSATEVPGPDAEEEIREAVLRELISLEGWSSAAAYCVSVGAWEARRDPSEALLARFRDHRPEVIPGTRCSYDPMVGAVYRPTGKLAQLYLLEAAEITGRSATVAASAYVHGLGAAGFHCELSWEVGRWSLRACEMTWVA